MLGGSQGLIELAAGGDPSREPAFAAQRMRQLCVPPGSDIVVAGGVRRLALEGRAVRRSAKPLNAATSRRPGRQGAGAGGRPARSRSAVYGTSAARIAATAWAMAARGAGVAVIALSRTKSWIEPRYRAAVTGTPACMSRCA